MCELCTEKDRTIHALEQAVSALTELVNTQRALAVPTAGPAAPYPAPAVESFLEQIAEEPDEDSIRAQLNAGGTDTETAERLLAQLQVVK